MGYKLADEVAINAPKATPPRDLLALIAIARRINDHTRTGWLTREEIAHWARIDVRSVKAMRERLVEAGLLVVLESGGGRRKATVFYIPPMPGYLPGQPPRPLDLELEAGPDFPDSGPHGSREGQKGGSPDFPVSPVDDAVDDRETGGKGGSPGFPVSGAERGKSGPQKGKFGTKRGKSGLPPNPLSTPHSQSSSSPYGVEEEPSRPAAAHQPEEDDKISKEDNTPAASRAARVITKRIGCPLDEAERVAQVIARENRIRKPLHIYVAGIPAADLRTWRETTRDQEAQQQAKVVRTTRTAGRCDLHWSSLPCIGCAADAKAMPDA
ncbi:hypothetical protein [Nonomuraea sp. NEAU-A123]|uniref:hypothetical protein n=1 Tax=Nonomuraea sp. NEAU-A123 TaxID=2839649 RepID=UPI001BE451FB|nr:hypothetical protein [Nonomuraea sp. NEAU-A123]MBT2234787.1 hypothetical protein [Nonomuraea sp. NEAU-A123]